MIGGSDIRRVAEMERQSRQQTEAWPKGVVALMGISENDQVRSSPHSVRRSTEWGASTSGERVSGRGRPLVECAGRAGRSRAPSAALRNAE